MRTVTYMRPWEKHSTSSGVCQEENQNSLQNQTPH